ncbi:MULTISPECIES: hypothetical protein [Giesbergeria]|uniref:Uncharacterized protein n=1 Tax=Giesbergeria sinuosa TaxID=80883 RepID=A0ABV9QBS7_9BURK
MSSAESPLSATPETLTAIVNVLGAVVFAAVRQLPADRQAAFAADLELMAANAQAQGEEQTSLLLADMCRAALAAAG